MQIAQNILKLPDSVVDFPSLSVIFWFCAVLPVSFSAHAQ